VGFLGFVPSLDFGKAKAHKGKTKAQGTKPNKAKTKATPK
jgi:hypothetical protein